MMSWGLGLVCLIWILTIFALAFLNWKTQTTNALMTSQILAENQRLANAIMSKDLTTFSTMQTLTQSNSVPVADPYLAGDDVSVAKRLADYYEAQGLDPSRAFDTPDDAIADFGGPQAFV